jgi:hypothetical protein
MDNVMTDPCLLQSILDFVGPGQHLYVSTVSKLVRECYGNVQAIELLECRPSNGAMKYVVTSQTTQYSEMCRSKSRLLLAVQCGVQQQFSSQGLKLQRTPGFLLAPCSSASRGKLEVAAAGDPQWLQKVSLGRYADKALLTFANNQLLVGQLFAAGFATLGAVIAGDLEKLQWLFLEKKATLCHESSMFAARYGHTNILKWLYEIKFPIHAASSREAALFGHLDVLQLLHANGHEWHADTCKAAVHSGRLTVLQWLYEHECPRDTTQVY